MGRININARLTPRETQIAELLAWGAARKEVADRLCISLRTVEATARHIFEKVGIQKATELCVYWFVAHCGVSSNLDPLKRVFAGLLLIAILPYELFGHDPSQSTRTGRSIRVTARAARPGRNRRQNIPNPFAA